MVRDLEGRIVVVTGGSGALGRAVVAELVAAGAEVVVPCIEVASPELPGARCVAGIDLTQETLVEGFYAGLERLWASVHVAGGFTWAKIEDTAVDLVRRQWAMNALTCFLCCREATRKIRASGAGGRIVNVSSRAARAPAAGVSAYTMSKAAVEGLTAQLAEELREEGVLVNAIAPGIIDTPTNRADMPGADHSRWTKPAELAWVIHQLVSPALAATTGAVVPVYGRS